jgi:fatty acid desaturase
MAVAARVKPLDYFTPDQWSKLSARSSWKGLALVAHGWAVIGLTMVASVLWPITIPLGIMIIGTRQLGLAVLQHDAAHGALHPNLKINDWVAEWLCSPGVQRYRDYHLQHHKYAQQAEDPDLILSAPFPISPTSLRRKIVRDLTGQTFLKQRFGLLYARKPGQPLWPVLKAQILRQKRFLISNGLGLLAFSLAGYAWVYVALWLVPMATWFPLVTRLRNIAEHALIAKDEPDPLRHARTTRANLIERALIAPYWVNYHAEHHMFMHMPCWSLPKAHKILTAKGTTKAMEMAPGYRAVLSAAAGA